MLIMLCEINALRTLNNWGIYPDVYTTDIRNFKDLLIDKHDATVVIMSIGNCRFITQEISSVIEFLDQAKETGAVKDYYLISDTEIYFKEYYMYKNNIEHCKHVYNYIKKDKGMVDFLSKLRKIQGQPKESEIHYSNFDKHDTTEYLLNLKKLEEVKDKYEDLIIIPDLNQIKINIHDSKEKSKEKGGKEKNEKVEV